MKKLVRLAGLSVMALSLTGGVAAANSGSIGVGDQVATGPDSTNKVFVETSDTRKAYNNNTVGVHNDNPQRAYSGDASVKHNTDALDAETGSASNKSNINSSLKINNSGSSAAALSGGSNGGGSGTGTIGTTGPDSYNSVKITDTSYAKVVNNNDVYVHTSNDQKASSGDAKVSDNTFGGNAISGNVSNESTISNSIEITN